MFPESPFEDPLLVLRRNALAVVTKDQEQVRTLPDTIDPDMGDVLAVPYGIVEEVVKHLLQQGVRIDLKVMGIAAEPDGRDELGIGPGRCFADILPERGPDAKVVIFPSELDLAVNRLECKLLFCEHLENFRVPDRMFQQVVVSHEHRQVVDHVMARDPDQQVELGIGQAERIRGLVGG